VGPIARLHEVAKRKYSCPCRESNQGRPTCSLVTKLTEVSQYIPHPNSPVPCKTRLHVHFCERGGVNDTHGLHDL
jgi:hypothetical protein